MKKGLISDETFFATSVNFKSGWNDGVDVV